MMQHRSVKAIRVTSTILLFIVGLNALAAGYSFMAEPSGKGLGLTTDYIRNSPFPDYFIPGLVLFLVNGVLSLISALFVITQWVYYRQLLVVQGCLLLGWIMVQVVMVRDFNLLHFLCIVIGITLTMFGRMLVQRESRPPARCAR